MDGMLSLLMALGFFAVLAVVVCAGLWLLVHAILRASRRDQAAPWRRGPRMPK